MIARRQHNTWLQFPYPVLVCLLILLLASACSSGAVPDARMAQAATTAATASVPPTTDLVNTTIAMAAAGEPGWEYRQQLRLVEIHYSEPSEAQVVEVLRGELDEGNGFSGTPD